MTFVYLALTIAEITILNFFDQIAFNAHRIGINLE